MNALLTQPKTVIHQTAYQGTSAPVASDPLLAQFVQSSITQRAVQQSQQAQMTQQLLHQQQETIKQAQKE
ncbi:hypothetical protein ADUPG1_003437, partial [Aduncisulcus paluster]